VYAFLHHESRSPQLLDNLPGRSLCYRGINVEDSQRQKFFAAIAKFCASFLIDIEKAKRFWVHHLDGIVALVHQGSEQLQFPYRALVFAHLGKQTLAGRACQFLRPLVFGNIMGHTSHNRRSHAFGPQCVVVFPDSAFARPRHHGHQAVRLPDARNLLQVGIKLGAELRRNYLSHGNPQHLLDAVSKHSRRSGIHGQQPAFKIVDAQQILAVLDQILIPVFVFLESPPDGIQLGRTYFPNTTFLWPRVQIHGYSLRAG
jgi:hypothetical protein